jgi:hypothetical protein
MNIVFFMISLNLLFSQMTSTTQSYDRQYVCKTCSWICRGPTPQKIRRHQLDYHQLKGGFECSKCHMSFQKKRNCLRHISFNHKQKKQVWEDWEIIRYLKTKNDHIDTKWERKVVAIPILPTVHIEDQVPVEEPPRYRPFPRASDLMNYNSVTGLARSHLPSPCQLIDEKDILEALAWCNRQEKEIHQRHQDKLLTLGKAQEALRVIINDRHSIEQRIARDCKKGR